MNEIEVKISKCTNCPYHDVDELKNEWPQYHHQILFCTKTRKRKHDEDHYGIDNGLIPYRTVGIDSWKVETVADIPDWCPYVLERCQIVYDNVFKRYCDPYSERIKKALRIIDCAFCIAEECESYPYAYDEINEKKMQLMKIALLFYSCPEGCISISGMGASVAKRVLEYELTGPDLEAVLHLLFVSYAVDDAGDLVDALVLMAIEYARLWKYGWGAKFKLTFSEDDTPDGGELRLTSSPSGKMDEELNSIIRQCVSVTKSFIKQYLVLGRFNLLIDSKRTSYKKYLDER